jgi:hypothetical protein
MFFQQIKIGGEKWCPRANLPTYIFFIHPTSLQEKEGKEYMEGIEVEKEERVLKVTVK